MAYYTYILYSQKLDKYYVGHTINVEHRLQEHNRGKSKFTKNGLPWQLVKYFESVTKAEASKFESKIKRRGCERFLNDNKFVL
ncbi:MAG: GIY-YIG nuclease family protein [Ignavibacteria bacterium]